MQTLDWRPHAKADFHVCKKQSKENEDEVKDVPEIQSSAGVYNDNDVIDDCNIQYENENSDDDALQATQTEETQSERTTNES